MKVISGVQLLFLLTYSFTAAAAAAALSATKNIEKSEDETNYKPAYLRKRKTSLNTSYWCGNSWEDAKSKCNLQCPEGLNRQCPTGEKCFGGITSCSDKSLFSASSTTTNTKVSVSLFSVPQ